MSRARSRLFRFNLPTVAMVITLLASGCVPNLSGIKFMYPELIATDTREPSTVMLADEPYGRAARSTWFCPAMSS